VTPLSVVIEHDTVLSRFTSGAALTLRGVRKSFGAKTVLSGVDLHVPAGQFLAVVGRSGCGKSTLLRLIAGLNEPTAGRIEAEGVAEGRSRLARIMFQEPRLLPWARAAANVAIGLGPAPDHTQAVDRSRDALAMVGLLDRAGEWPSTLSGGQKQRVALARALVSAPRILALDEPLGALDALTRIEMQRLVEQVWLANGFTAILVTHDVTEAVALGDRIVLIDHGAIATDIPVHLARPRRRGSAEFTGVESTILERLLASADQSSTRNGRPAVSF
jgi:sulfonate transport system ATP-binding protein